MTSKLKAIPLNCKTEHYMFTKKRQEFINSKMYVKEYIHILETFYLFLTTFSKEYNELGPWKSDECITRKLR